MQHKSSAPCLVPEMYPGMVPHPLKKINNGPVLQQCVQEMWDCLKVVCGILDFLLGCFIVINRLSLHALVPFLPWAYMKLMDLMLTVLLACRVEFSGLALSHMVEGPK